MGSRVPMLMLIVCVAGDASTIRAQTPFVYPCTPYPDALTTWAAKPRPQVRSVRPLPPIPAQQAARPGMGSSVPQVPAFAAGTVASDAAGTCWDDPTVGPSFRVFEPKARVYFDTGWEAPDKLNLFHDGSLVPSINFLELFWRRRWPRHVGHRDWRWGPTFGAGISSQAGDSGNGAQKASGAPVLLLSAGLQTEFPLNTWQLSWTV